MHQDISTAELRRGAPTMYLRGSAKKFQSGDAVLFRVRCL
jgi:hypothetical protein